MLSFESQFLKPTSALPYLIHLSWFLLTISSLSGILLLYSTTRDRYWVLRNSKLSVRNAAVEPAIPKSVATIQRLLFDTQLTSFVISIILLTIFKAMNL